MHLFMKYLISDAYINNDYLISIFPFANILKNQQPENSDNAINNLLNYHQIYGSGDQWFW